MIAVVVACCGVCGCLLCTEGIVRCVCAGPVGTICILSSVDDNGPFAVCPCGEGVLQSS